jgi:DNA repair protein RecO (recombination protein O)
MQWTDSGIVLGVRRHGESSVILELMTRSHGRHLGVVRGGRGRRHAAALQPGNSVRAVWQARIEDHLGAYAVEAEEHRAASLIGSGGALYAVGHLAALTRLLPEREPHEGLHAALDLILGRLDDLAVAGPLVVRYEAEILRALGFGLDLAACAATGSAEDLVYVSPKSGRAVSRQAGEPYRDRLLPLPAFLSGGVRAEASGEALAAGLRLTGFFLERHVYAPRGLTLPEQRAAFAEAVLRALGPSAAQPRP